MTAGNLIYWIVALLVLAILAVVFGLGGIPDTAISEARVLTWIAVAALVIVVIMGLVLRRRRR